MARNDKARRRAEALDEQAFLLVEQFEEEKRLVVRRMRIVRRRLERALQAEQVGGGTVAAELASAVRALEAIELLLGGP